MMPFDSKSILVVDDEEFIRQMISEEFASLGASVAEAPNGKVALSMLKQDRYDVVISDVRMPDGDGIKLIQEINAHIQPCPKLFLCSGFNEHSVSDMMNLGVIAFFSKPFDWDELIERVRQSLVDDKGEKLGS